MSEPVRVPPLATRDVGARGVRVRFYEGGSGQPVLLVHGYLWSGTVWADVFPLLAKNLRVIVPDLPGFGESEKPSPARYAYGLEAFVESLVDLIATLGVMTVGERTEVIRNMVRCAGPDDVIAISVFAGEAFVREAKGLYRQIPTIVGGNPPDAAFDTRKAEFRLPGSGGRTRYLSHWFARGEIEQILRAERCEILESRSINNSGHFVTAKSTSNA